MHAHTCPPPPPSTLRTLTIAAAWNRRGARGRHAGVEQRVADLRIAESSPDMANTLPAGTDCRGQRGERGVKHTLPTETDCMGQRARGEGQA